jgi:glycosyltransferase EpsD
MHNRIKVVYIIESFDIGGREKIVLDLCNGLNKDIFDVSLIVLSNDKLSSLDFLNNDIKTYSLNMKQKELRNLNLFFKGLSQFIDILKNLKPNIIHSHIFYMPLFLTSLAIKLSNKNILHFRTVHTVGLFYENQKTLLNKFRLLVEKIATKMNQTYIIGISNVVHTNNIKYFKKYSNDTKLIYNGIDLNQFDKQNYHCSKNDFGFQNDDIVISYVARLDNGKNHLFLIDLWKDIKTQIPNVIVCFAGDGVLKKELTKQVKDKDLEDNIKFLGSISNVSELLAISDLAVFPSSFEGFGLVMLEKFAMSLPVVASNIDAFKETGEDGENCFLVSLEDRNLYKKRIIELCESERLRKQIGANARFRAMEFHIKKCITSHEEYYLKSLK